MPCCELEVRCKARARVCSFRAELRASSPNELGGSLARPGLSPKFIVRNTEATHGWSDFLLHITGIESASSGNQERVLKTVTNVPTGCGVCSTRYQRFQATCIKRIRCRSKMQNADPKISLKVFENMISILSPNLPQ